MKKIIPIVLCVFSGMVHAFGPSCALYKIQIKNTGSADCVLKKQYILYGKLVKDSHIPDVIFRGQQAQFEMTNSNINLYLEAGVVLNYECGDDKEVTFFSTTPMRQPNLIIKDNVLTAVIDSKNMAASFEASWCNNIYGTPYEVTWVLNP